MTDNVGARVGITGTAVVCCVHDREKRSLTTLEFDAGEYDPKRYQPEVCVCCENIYLRDLLYLHNTVVLCDICRGRTVHAPSAPLPWEGAT